MSSLQKALSLTLATGILTFVGCGGGANNLIGKWELDTAKMMEQMKDKGDGDNPAEAMATAMAAAMKMTMEFKSGGKMSVSVMGQSMEGEYKVKSTSGDTVTVEGTMEGKTETLNIKFLDANTIEMSPPGQDDKMTFKRV